MIIIIEIKQSNLRFARKVFNLKGHFLFHILANFYSEKVINACKDKGLKATI